MANEIYNYFVKAEKLGGIKARTRLSFLTQTSSLQAKSLIDSQENIELFKDAFGKLTEEFDNSPEPLSFNPVKKSCGEATIQLRKMIHAFVDLIAQRSLFLNDFDATCERITETLAFTLELERTSIWLIDRDKNLLICKDLFRQSKNNHSNGLELKIKDYPIYFEALNSERTLPVNDTFKDERTKELIDIYFKPYDVHSLMDIPIWSKGRMIGVICLEQVSEKRAWSSDDENFAYLMSNFISLSSENSDCL